MLSEVSSWLYGRPSFTNSSPSLSLSPSPRLSLQWQREGDPLGGDTKRRRRLALTSRRWRRGGDRGEGGRCSSTVHPGTTGQIHLFIYSYFNFQSRFVLALPLLAVWLHCRKSPLRPFYILYVPHDPHWTSSKTFNVMPVALSQFIDSTDSWTGTESMLCIINHSEIWSGFTDTAELDKKI